MVDMEKVKVLTSLLEERSGLDVREAVARNIHYLDGYESYLYEKEIEYLLETLDVEEEPPFCPGIILLKIKQMLKFHCCMM